MNFESFLAKYQKEPFEEYANKVPQDVTLSICVQTYQHANFVRDCLEGILIQETDFPFEVLVGEDCSTDGTREICIEYAATYPDKIRLFLHSRANNIQRLGKPSSTFNFVYNLFSARGEYIALCEGDDYWTDPHKLQKQVDFLRDNPDFAICAHRPLVLEAGANAPLPLIGARPSVSGFEDLARNGNYLHTPTVVFRNRFSEKGIPNYFVETEILDWPIHLFNASHGKIMYLDEPMAVYRKHSGGMWSGGGRTVIDHYRGMLRVVEVLSGSAEDWSNSFDHLKAKMLSELLFLEFARKEFKTVCADYLEIVPIENLLPPRTRFGLAARVLVSRLQIFLKGW